MPGRPGQKQAPNISFWLASRGINIGLNTRMYFADEGAANAADPVLGSIEQRQRVTPLIAARTASGLYRFDIHPQGPRETVFIDI